MSGQTKKPRPEWARRRCIGCGCALYRLSAQSGARKISCYRGLGSDAWRHLSDPLCDSRPVRQEPLEDPAPVSAETDRRVAAGRTRRNPATAAPETKVASCVRGFDIAPRLAENGRDRILEGGWHGGFDKVSIETLFRIDGDSALVTGAAAGSGGSRRLRSPAPARMSR